ncbi:MAG TPA: heavy metal-binding domain-containing protein [Chryseosolibacter sp.]
MKSIVKTLAFSAVLCSALFFTSCNTDKGKVAEAEQAHDHESGDHEHTYACPMHPEVTGKEGEECSKCGMKLTLVDNSATKNEYFMHFSATPAVEAGKAATLTFTPKIKGNESEVVPLDVQHDKKLHLIVVSKDLSYFDHIHPEFNSDGSYQITVLPNGKAYSKGQFASETRFDKGGDYVLFADYLPSGATHQLERIELNVAGAPYTAQQFRESKTVSKVDGYEVSLIPEGGKFLSNGTMHISAIVKKDGKEIPADQFENYLAAKAHVVMISEDTKDYLHVHPEVVDGRLDLHTEFGKAGVFRGWLQFQTDGKVHTADFVVKVEEGTAPVSTHAAATEHKH